MTVGVLAIAEDVAVAVNSDKVKLYFINNAPKINIKGTRCLGSDEFVHKKRLKPFVIKCTWLERCFKSRI